MNSSPDVVSTATYTPAETVELVSRAGVRKGNMRPDKVFLSAVSAGCLLSVGCAVTLSTLAAPWFQENAPGLIKMIGALVFPLGIAAVVLTGADLFTASTMFTTVAALHRRLSIEKMFQHWFLCWWGNLAGSLFVMAIIFGYGGVFDSSPFREEVITFVTKKQVTPQFHQIFLRAIGCNWLVCLGVMLSYMAKDVTSKIVAIWWPVFAFVSLGLDHSIANMFIVPLGIFLHTPGLTVGLYIWKGMIPATLGNILGGAVFCGGYYWWMYLFGEQSLPVDGTRYSGPVGKTISIRFKWPRIWRRKLDEESGEAKQSRNSSSTT